MIVLRFIEVLHLVIDLRDAGDGGGVIRIHRQDIIESRDRLFGQLNVLLRLSPRDIELGVSRREIELGIKETRIQADRFLEVHNSSLELGIAESGNTLIKLVTCLQSAAAARGNRQQ